MTNLFHGRNAWTIQRYGLLYRRLNHVTHHPPVRLYPIVLPPSTLLPSSPNQFHTKIAVNCLTAKEREQGRRSR